MMKIGIVGGAGHVGFPLGLAFAEQGFQVALFDQDQARLASIADNKTPFYEEKAQELLRKNLARTLHPQFSLQDLIHQEVVFFCLPHQAGDDPSLKLAEFLPHLRRDQILILRSTVGLGQSRKWMQHWKSLGFEKTAYCPERIAQGKSLQELRDFPQLMATLTSEIVPQLQSLFSCITVEVIELSPEETEFAKLMCNSWRYLEMAAANQFYMMAESQGLSFYRILEAAQKNYPRASHYMGAGLTGGPCLPKDAFMMRQSFEKWDLLGSQVQRVQELMPDFLVQQLEKKMGTLENKKILVLGLAFKANSDDERGSRVSQLILVLKEKKSQILLTDPYLKPEPSLLSLLQEADGVLLACPHASYQNLQIEKPFVDCWNFWGEK